jgi:hypothetical protein
MLIECVYISDVFRSSNDVVRGRAVSFEDLMEQENALKTGFVLQLRDFIF